MPRTFQFTILPTPYSFPSIRSASFGSNTARRISGVNCCHNSSSVPPPFTDLFLRFQVGVLQRHKMEFYNRRYVME